MKKHISSSKIWKLGMNNHPIDNQEFARSTRGYVIRRLLDLDDYIFVKEGPHEIFSEFVCHFGYEYSKMFMDKIVPTGVFSEKELDILLKIEALMVKLLKDHTHIKSWDNLQKHEYLELKSLCHDFFTIVYDLKNY